MWFALVLAACAPVKQFDVDLELLDDAALPGDDVDGVHFGVALFDERDSWYLPAFVDVDDLGAVWLADSVLRAAGQPPVIDVSVSGLTLDSDAPLVLGVDVIADDGGQRYIADLSIAEAPARPGACSLQVDDDTTDAGHAADLLACLQSWVDVLGGPVTLHLEVAVIETEATDFAFSAEYVLSTAKPTVAACTGASVADGTFQEQADSVDLTALELAGYAIAESERTWFVAFENTWAADTALPGSGGVAWAEVQGGQGVFFGTELEVTGAPRVPMAGPESIATFPRDWIGHSVDALSGPDGFVDACWIAVHDALPNETWVHFALVGEGTYTGG